MIRVLQIVNSMDRGGIETTLMNIFRNIDRNKIVFDFLLQTNKKCAYNDEILSLGGKIYTVTPRREGILRNKKELQDFFKIHKDDYKIIHMHVGSLTYIEPLKAAKKYNIPVRIIHSRNTKCGGLWFHNILHYINKLTIDRWPTHYFSCSDLAGRWLYKKNMINSSQYRIINNGIETEKFQYSPLKREHIRKQLNCENNLAIVNVGRLHKQKNHKFLLKIFSEVLKINPNSILYLIGNGKLKNNLKNIAKHLKIEENVKFLGTRDNINELLQGMDIFVMPSFYEGLPGSVIEAQGAGLECLISDTITRNVAITELVNYKSIKSPALDWAKKIIELSDNKVRKNTKQLIKEKGFDMKDIAKKLQEFYIEVNEEKDNES